MNPASDEKSSGRMLISLATAGVVLTALAFRRGAVLGLVILAIIFVPLEKILALHPQRVMRKDWRTDLAHFFVNNVITNALLIVPVVVLGLGMRAAIPTGLRHSINHQTTAAQVVQVLLLTGVAGYWAHRLTHRVPALWRFHKVHHSSEQMDWLAAARLHPIDSVFTKTVTVLPIFALGYSRVALGGFIMVTTFQAVFIHANIRIRFGPLRWIIATPELHHWHHANDPAAYNSNFAGEFPWLDALFGTLHLPPGQMPAGYGIEDTVPQGYLRQLASPFRPARAVDVTRVSTEIGPVLATAAEQPLYSTPGDL